MPQLLHNFPVKKLRPVAYLFPFKPYTGAIPNRLGANPALQFKGSSGEARHGGRVSLQHQEHCMLPTVPNSKK